MPSRVPLLFLLLALLWAAPAHAQETIYSESFDDLAPPAMPATWSAAGDGWRTDGASASPGSGLNNLVHSGTLPGTVTTGPVNLTGVSAATLSFLARRTSSYDAAHLVVTASTDGGATFPHAVLPAGSALPDVTSSYTPVSAGLSAALLGVESVFFRFEASGGSSSSSNLRIDDFLVAGERGDAPPPPAGDERFGFATAVSDVLSPVASFEVPLSLETSSAPGIQGLQGTISWSSDLLSFVGLERGAAVADEEAWTLAYETGTSEVRFVLLGNGAAGLAPGRHDPLLVLRLAAGAVAMPGEEVTLTLSGVVGALASADGTDAGLAADPAEHTVSVLPGAAYLSLSATSIDFGTGPVETPIVRELRVRNPGGTRPLTVTWSGSSNALFSVTPASVVVAPGGEETVSVSFTPSFIAFGRQEGQLVFGHDGEGEASVPVTIAGLGVGGQGDAAPDGRVDALDLVEVIDYVLLRRTPGGPELRSADLFPFGAADGRLDVRDLTVLAQAIVGGGWPDGHPLPAEIMPPAAAKGSAAPVRLHLVQSAEGLRIEVEHTEPLRAFQLVLGGAPLAGKPELLNTPGGKVGELALAGLDAQRGTVRLLTARTDGSATAPGRRALALVPIAGAPDGAGAVEGILEGIDVRYVAAVGERGRMEVAVYRERDEAPAGEVPDVLEIGAPHPNPARGGSTVVVPLGLPEAGPLKAELFDLLGKRVAVVADGPWAAGTSELRVRLPAAPGLYLLRVAVAGRHAVQRIVVL